MRHTNLIAAGLIVESGKRQNKAVIGSHFWIAWLCMLLLAAKRVLSRLSRAKRDSSKAALESDCSSKGASDASSILVCTSC